MKVISFPYQKFHEESYPIIPIFLKGPQGFVKVDGYVDSGASISIFDAQVAEQIGIHYDVGEPRYTMVGDGSYIPLFVHRIRVRIDAIAFFAHIGFSSHLGASMNLIGQMDFFDRFVITFNRPQGIISFQPSPHINRNF